MPCGLGDLSMLVWNILSVLNNRMRRSLGVALKIDIGEQISPFGAISRDLPMSYPMRIQVHKTTRFTRRNTTCNMISSVTYYLGLHNAIAMYCTSHFL